MIPLDSLLKVLINALALVMKDLINAVAVSSFGILLLMPSGSGPLY